MDQTMCDSDTDANVFFLPDRSDVTANQKLKLKSFLKEDQNL